MNQAQYGAQPRRPARARPHVLLRATSSSAGSIRPGLDTIPPASVAVDQRAAGGGRLSGPAGRDRACIRIPVDTTNVLGKVDHQVERRAISSASATACTTSASTNSRGAGGLNAPSASAGARQPRSDDRGQQHADAVGAHGERNARAVRARRPEAPPTDPIGPAVSIAGVASFGTLLGQPDAPRQHAVPGRRQPVAPGRRARAARRRRLPLQRRHASPIRGRFAAAYTFSSLAELPGRRLQQRRLHADVRRDRGVADQPERRRLRAGRVEGRPGRDAERRRCATTCSSSRRSTPTRNNVSPRVGVRVVAVRRRGARSCAAAPGSSTTACRCARWPTRCCRPATRPTWPTCGRSASACRRRRPARRRSRTSCSARRAVGHAAST